VKTKYAKAPIYIRKKVGEPKKQDALHLFCEQNIFHNLKIELDFLTNKKDSSFKEP